MPPRTRKNPPIPPGFVQVAPNDPVHISSSSSSSTTNSAQPSYRPPTFLYIFIAAIREIFWQGGACGVVASYLAHPFLLYLFRILTPVVQGFRGVGTDEQLIDRTIFAMLTPIFHITAYIFFNAFFALCDQNKWFAQYKLPRSNLTAPTSPLILRTLFEASLSQIVGGPLLAYYVYPIFKYFGMAPLNSPLPSPLVIFYHVSLMHIFNDIFFYFSHRLLHWGPLYKTIHKQHHEYKATISIAAEFAHPIEYLFSDVLPTIGGGMVLGSHPHVTIMWVVLRSWQTFETHSGYCFAGSLLDKLGLAHSRGAAHHDFHHSKNIGNYGEGEYMDYLFGTLTAYVNAGMMDGYRKGIKTATR